MAQADEPPHPDAELVPDPPGAPAFSDALRATLAAHTRASHADRDARTRHFRPDGLPRYTNRLALESSPYLLQHAHNPVNWFPWGDEAFALATELDRPVFLSVGYSTCHWCHVMEEESFEDEEIAAYMNANFVCIKVDREQRPDVDDIYMTAVYHFSGRGGWPMTVVMTPDRQPFFGATYIPARDGDRGAATGLLTVLQQLRALYHTDSATVSERAEEVARYIARATQPGRPGDVPGPEVLSAAVDAYFSRFDARWGGIGSRPKFPQPSIYGMLLRYHRRTGDDRALQMVTKTLERMAQGGIYDQVAGGFHRYSTDDRWLVPHFEKMLYDNAQLAALYLEAFQVTGRGDFARIARETLDYVAREMTAPHGGFYSATDADSEGEEGTFFLWTLDEIRSLLSPLQADLVIAHYGVTARGNFEHRNILHVARDLDAVGAELGLRPEQARETLEAARQRLYEARQSRVPPGLDDKVLTSWNGLMIGAFARGALVLDDDGYARQAQAAATFLHENMWREGRLYRSHRDGRTEHLAFLDDYAFLIAGLLDLYEADADARWLEWAIALQGVLDQHFADPMGGGYFFTGDEHEALLARQKPDYDGAEPTGNSVGAENLLRLAELTTDSDYRRAAERLFGAFADNLARRPTSVPRLLSALDFYLDRPRELVFVTPAEGGSAEPFFGPLRRTFLPNRVVVTVSDGEATEQLADLVPLVERKVAMDGQTTAYVCEAGICERPTTDPAVFAAQIAPITPYEEEEEEEEEASDR